MIKCDKSGCKLLRFSLFSPTPCTSHMLAIHVPHYPIHAFSLCRRCCAFTAHHMFTVDETATFLIPNTLISSIYNRLLLQLQCHTLAVTLRPFLAIFQPLPINSDEYLQFPMIFTYFQPTSAFFGNFQQYYLYQDSSRPFPTTFGSFPTASSPRT